jgi:hypothetical protein
MTIKEVAEAYGVSRDLIEKKVREIFPGKMRRGVKTILTEEECTMISMRLKENTSLIATSDDRRKLPTTQIERNLLVIQAFEILQDDNRQLLQENKNLQIELNREKSWYSVKRVKSLGLLPNLSAKKIWSPLKRWCIENDRQIRTIFDANYGNVKTYHADAWKAVYGLDLYFNGKSLEYKA